MLVRDLFERAAQVHGDDAARRAPAARRAAEMAALADERKG